MASSMSDSRPNVGLANSLSNVFKLVSFVTFHRLLPLFHHKTGVKPSISYKLRESVVLGCVTLVTTIDSM